MSLCRSGWGRLHCGSGFATCPEWAGLWEEDIPRLLMAGCAVLCALHNEMWVEVMYTPLEQVLLESLNCPTISLFLPMGPASTSS